MQMVHVRILPPVPVIQDTSMLLQCQHSAELALLGRTAHVQILLTPVCLVQLTQPQVELLLQFAPALEGITELHRRVQMLAALVSLLNVIIVPQFHHTHYPNASCRTPNCSQNSESDQQN